MLMLILLVLLFMVWPGIAGAACTGSSPTWTTSVDYTSFNSCVAGATAGDTINVLAGSDTWSSYVAVNKELHIVGAGVDQTSITAAAHATTLMLVTGSNTTISNMEFVCAFIWMDQAMDWRVHHNRFTCGTHNFGILVKGSGLGPATPRGLIDHNDFDDMRIYIQSHALTTVATLQGSSHWTRGPEFGTNDGGIYIEDNTFFETTGNAVDCQYSGRYVARFNDIVDTYLEAHSAQYSSRGCRGSEIYHNAFDDAAGGNNPFYVMFLRAGSWMVFSNTATGTFGSGGLRFDNQRSCQDLAPAGQADGTSGWDENTSPIETYRGYLARDQIGSGADVSAWGASDPYPPAQGKSPSYTWLNTHNGSSLVPNVPNNPAGCYLSNDYNQTHIVKNRDYYQEDTTNCVSGSTCTEGVGYGTSLPTSCTTGTGYWKTDEGSWNKMPGGSQGVLYKCTATDTWSLSYTPYDYPHPLQGFVPRRFAPLMNLHRASWPIPYVNEEEHHES